VRFFSLLAATGLAATSLAATPAWFLSAPAAGDAPRAVEISGTLPLAVTEVELRFRSARNAVMSKITDISPNHPAPDTVLPYPRPDKEVWYPVVDLELNAGMSGHLRWKTAPRLVAVNHHFHGKAEAGSREMSVPAAMLESWENNAYCEPAVALEDFYLAARVPVINGALKYALRPLGTAWAGAVTMVDATSGREIEIARFAPPPSPAVSAVPPAAALEHANLEQSLIASLNYLLRSQNGQTSSPTFGGLHLFYDLDAQTFRSSYWIWGAGPAVSALLEAGKFPAIARNFPAHRLGTVANQIGRSGLGLRIMDPTHPAYGIPLSRWRRAIELPFGFEQCAAPSDALFLSGWAWIPLYRATGNADYLKAAELLAASTARLMHDYELVPQDYYVDRHEWSEHTIDESGFGVEGLNALYQATGERRYQQQADDYMKQHLAKLARTDGVWERGWNRRTGVMPTIRMTRGLGWAMEGLLAAHQAVPEGGYLAHARRMADQMAKWQLPDGSWIFIADGSVARKGSAKRAPRSGRSSTTGCTTPPARRVTWRWRGGRLPGAWPISTPARIRWRAAALSARPNTPRSEPAIAPGSR
jgi:hypothetical protein